MVALFAGAKFSQKRALSLFSIATTEKKDRSSVTCVYIFALYLNASIKREEETEKDIKNAHTHLREEGIVLQSIWGEKSEKNLPLKFHFFLLLLF